MPMKHPNPDMLLRIAQADAYGAATEYLRLPRDQAILDAALRFDGYLAHPTHDRSAGQYTDDTQMSIAVAEVMFGHLYSHDDIVRQLLADAFVCAFRRDRRTGYARGFQVFLESEAAASGEAFLRNIRPNSEKNGAAMRAVPIGVLPNPNAVIRVALINASLTHDTLAGRTSSVIVALLSHFALYTDEPFTYFLWWCRACGLPERESVFHFARISHMLQIPWSGPVQEIRGKVSSATATTHAVIHLLTRTSSLRESMLQAIRWGGDVDSVMAITWGIQSTRLCKPLPQWLDTGLENGSYGRDFLKDLGVRLMMKYA